MKRSLVILCGALALNLQAASMDDMINKGVKIATHASSGDYKSLVSEALNAAVSELSKEGFINNATAKIPLPKSLEMASNLAKKVGGEKWAQDLSKSINNAATTAVPKAAEIFSESIKNMSEADVKKLFNSGSDSVTKYLEKSSSQKLKAAFTPIIEKMMSDNSFATAYNGLNSFIGSSAKNNETIKSVKSLAKNLGASEYVPDDGEDLNAYITRKTLDGLFNVMSEKEKGLRSGFSLDSGKKVLDSIFK